MIPRRFLVWPVIVIISLIPQGAKAQEKARTNDMSALSLYQLCSSQSNVDYGMCAGYVTALADILMNETVTGYKACHFGEVRTQELMDIVKNYIANNPDMNDRPARVVASAALARAFPCQ